MIRRPALTAASAAAVAVALLPLVYLAVRAGEAGGDRIAAELFTARVAVLALRSLALAAVVTAACAVLGVGTALLVARTDLPGRRVFGVVATLPLAVPTYVAGFAWTATVTGFEGFWAAALLLTLCSYPYVFLPAVAALNRTDPGQEEVSRSLGRGPWATLFGVTLRQIRPAVAAGALLVALYVLSDFGAVSIVRVDTFTRAIFTAFNLGFDRTGALVLSTVLVLLTVLLIGAELTTRTRDARYASTAVRPPVRLRLARWRGPALAGLLAVNGLALGVPAAGLARWLAAGVSRPGSLAEIAAAAGASLTVSLAGAALTMLLALPLGLLTARAPGPVATVLDRLTYVAHALPGVVIGLSLVFFAVNVAYPLYQSAWLLALAYAALFLPLAVGAVAAAAAQSPPAVEEAARSLGRGPFTVFRTVTLPLTLPGIGAGAALTFLTCVKELPATLLLRPTGMDTLATELWTHTSTAAYAAAAPYAAILVALAAVPTWLLAVRTGLTGGAR
ncbi:ABC transporter permease subunit [Micromonospora sp. DR5-3]|uniref:ABC transporter permease n=1 Tax=unclassified Micromonospora TaxID=2617518 RepID=UPI0011DB264F|nr:MULTISPECIES: ABC transporter permease subunit [unclassified Micromonospora]MCW3816738.1 ABC transporter permease subunit [Micromonospora sp. DR5-3]TYC20684.1 iron ABC transporter permease [Micromonospora sp. MP36]